MILGYKQNYIDEVITEAVLIHSECLCRYITVDELETVFKEYNMGDDATIATIREIMSEVDRDKVINLVFVFR